MGAKLRRSDRRVLALLSFAARPLTGFELMQATGLGATRLYPSLARLRDQGRVAGNTDSADGRVLYTLAASG